MSRNIFLAAAGLVLLCAMPLAAQDAVLGQLYGNGVHAYFSQDYLKAHEYFTAAIDGHSQDPRVYYFRGLDLLKLGRPQGADADFKQGAKLESAVDPTRVYNVARALERVQGSDRARLESFRLEARMFVLKKAEEDHARRYQETVKEQRDFLQQQSAASVKPVETPAESSTVPEAVQAPKGAAPPEDPFSTGEPGKAPAAKAEPAMPLPGQETPAEKAAAKPDTGTEPFGAEAAPAKPAAGGAPVKTPQAAPDPFGQESAPAKSTAPASGGATKPAAAADDPFGAADADKPATPAAPSKKPAGAKSAAPAAGDDPFAAEQDAGKSPAPAAAGAAAKKPDKPDAAKPAPAGNDDPFAPGQ